MSRRHNSKFRRLNMSFNQRKALVRQQLNTLIEKGALVTTEARGKLVKVMFDKIASKAKEATLHDRRNIASSLANPRNADRLVDTVNTVMSDRVSGFTKITKVGLRRGDAAMMVRLELSAKPAKKEVEKPAKTKPVAKKNAPKAIKKTAAKATK